MSTSLRRRHERRRLAALSATFLWIGIAGCHSWSTIQSAPPREEQVARAEHLRVFTNDGEAFDLRYDIHVVGDSLVGYEAPPLPYNQRASGRRAIAVADIASIRQRKSNAVGTSLLIVGGVLVGAGLICAASDCFDFGFGWGDGSE